MSWTSLCPLGRSENSEPIKVISSWGNFQWFMANIFAIYARLHTMLPHLSKNDSVTRGYQNTPVCAVYGITDDTNSDRYYRSIPNRHGVLSYNRHNQHLQQMHRVVPHDWRHRNISSVSPVAAFLQLQDSKWDHDWQRVAIYEQYTNEICQFGGYYPPY